VRQLSRSISDVFKEVGITKKEWDVIGALHGNYVSETFIKTAVASRFDKSLPSHIMLKDFGHSKAMLPLVEVSNIAIVLGNLRNKGLVQKRIGITTKSFDIYQPPGWYISPEGEEVYRYVKSQTGLPF
jgi:hypothetical protein